MDLTTMTPAQIKALTPAELASYAASDLAQLTADQVAALTQDQMAALDSGQLAAIEPAIESYQQLVGSFQAVQAAAAAAARAAFLKPVTDLLGMPEYQVVKAAVLAIGSTFDGESFGSTLNCLRTGFGNLHAPA